MNVLTMKINLRHSLLNYELYVIDKFMSYKFFILTSHLSDLRPLLLDHLVDFVDRRHIYQDSGWRGNCCKDLSCNNKINPDNVSSSTMSVCV